MSLELHTLPEELVEAFENPEAFLQEPAFEAAPESAVLALDRSSLLQRALLYMFERELLPRPIYVSSRPAALRVNECDGWAHWHRDFETRPRAETIRTALFVAGEPRTEFKYDDGSIYTLERGKLAFFDCTTVHRGRPARRPSARWLVRFTHLPDPAQLRGGSYVVRRATFFVSPASDDS